MLRILSELIWIWSKEKDIIHKNNQSMIKCDDILNKRVIVEKTTGVDWVLSLKIGYGDW